MINDIMKEPTPESRILLALEALVGEGSLDERLKIVYVLVGAILPGTMLWPFSEWLNKEWPENPQEPVITARGLLAAVLTKYRVELNQSANDIETLTIDRDEQKKERRAWAETAQAKTSELITCASELDLEKGAVRRLLGDIDNHTRTITRLTKQRDRLQGKLDAALEKTTRWH